MFLTRGINTSRTLSFTKAIGPSYRNRKKKKKKKIGPSCRWYTLQCLVSDLTVVALFGIGSYNNFKTNLRIRQTSLHFVLAAV